VQRVLQEMMEQRVLLEQLVLKVYKVLQVLLDLTVQRVLLERLD
jgi:hypothetical protein